MRSFLPTQPSTTKKTWPPSGGSSSGSSSSPPTSSFVSPRKTSTTITPSWQTNRLKKVQVHQDDTSCSSFNGDSFSTSNGGSASDLALNFRMQLFDSKAEIEYLEEEDDIAALVYGVDNHSPVKKSRSPVKQMKEGVSGYNFSALLKDQKI